MFVYKKAVITDAMLETDCVINITKMLLPNMRHDRDEKHQENQLVREYIL